MSTVDPGMEALLDTFIYETNTELEQLDEILLGAEQDKSISEDNINSIFRITHTIKGSAAMMGFTGISALAHSVEDVFYILRDDPTKLHLVFGKLFDLIFQSSDFLKQEMERVSDDDYAENDPKPLIALLSVQAGIMKGDSAEASAAAPTAPIVSVRKTPISGSANDYRIRIFFEDDCQMENMRAFMLLTQLQHCCEMLTSEPEHPENDASTCADIVKDGLLIICRPTESIDDIVKLVENALSIKSYEVLASGIEDPIIEFADVAEVSDDVTADSATASQTQAAATTSTAMRGTNTAKQSLISVNQGKLDHLLDLVGELVTAESMVASNPDLRGLRLDNFTKSIRELRKLTDELQDVVMSIRMVPLHGTFQKMNRIVRDMSKKLDKKAELYTEGGDTEVDKTINDAIADPFMHMIRNSMDHGIETPEDRAKTGKNPIGRITLSARNVGSDILIDVADDGYGLDPKVLLAKGRKNGILTKPEAEYSDKEAFQLIMLPGFSTNVEVTEFSGRGVGMDVVRRNVEHMGGSISISSTHGDGTVFTIKIPLTLAIVDGMNIAVGETVFTLPITSIKQSFKIADENQIITNTNGSEMIMIRGECLPIIRLHEQYGVLNENPDITAGIMIQVESGGCGACLYADELLGEYQVVVKPFPAFLAKYDLKNRGLSGCSILGDGSISLILDVNNLLSK